MENMERPDATCNEKGFLIENWCTSFFVTIGFFHLILGYFFKKAVY